MRSRRYAWPAALVVLVAASTAVRLLAVRSLPTPWVTPDETLYGLLARGLYEQGRLAVLGGHVAFYSVLYPAVAGLPLLTRDLSRGYQLLKAVQALLMSLTAVPVYLWARTVARPRTALVAAALTVALPGLTYAGMLMSEVAFYPVVTVAAWLTARALARPTLARQAGVLVAIAAVALIRLQGLLFVPAVLGAVLLKALFDRELRVVRACLPLVAAGVAVAVAAAVAGGSSLGGYATIASSGYDGAHVAEFVAYHAAALLLACGVVPVCAVALLAVDAVRGREPSSEVRATVAVVVSFSVCTVAVVGAFASRYADRILERGLLCLAPALFVGFAAWLDRGAPRRYVPAAVVAFAAAALLLVLPYDRFVVPESVQDSMTFAAALHVLAAQPRLSPLLLLGVTGTVLAALFALLPRRAAPVLVAALALLLAGASWGASREVRAASAAQQARLLGPDPRWIDRATAQPTGFVFGGGATFDTAWEHAFWNRRVRSVYDLPGARVLGPMPQRRLEVGGDGVLRAGGRPIRERLVVLPSFAEPAGTRLATTTLTGAGVAGLALWKLEGTPRLLERRGGFQPNGDIPYQAELREYGCRRGGTFLVTFFGKTAERVAVALNGRRVATVHLVKGAAPTQVVHAGAGRDGSCTLTLRPSTLVGTTEVRFARG
jgi:hypothetical protein